MPLSMLGQKGASMRGDRPKKVDLFIEPGAPHGPHGKDTWEDRRQKVGAQTSIRPEPLGKRQMGAQVRDVRLEWSEWIVN